MHELSLAREIIRVMEEHVPETDRDKVTSVIVEIGVHSNVVADSLRFSFDALNKSTTFEKTKMITVKVPVQISCLNCGEESRISEMHYLCPKCQSTQFNVIGGEDIRVKEIIVSELLCM